MASMKTRLLEEIQKIQAALEVSTDDELSSSYLSHLRCVTRSNVEFQHYVSEVHPPASVFAAVMY
jgi:hypothetical protein